MYLFNNIIQCSDPEPTVILMLKANYVFIDNEMLFCVFYYNVLPL